jgi:two-component system sensor histidine kinase KdpD
MTGHLTIFLGAAPGVGKTYAMLRAARKAQRKGISVIAAAVEAHGRVRTEKLLHHFPSIAKKNLIYKGKTFAELDTEAVLKAKPGLALIDELAHTNIPGSRHNKRYLDILEILKAGIDVYTTLNVQHLESFSASVKQITGISVRAIVPDEILLNADDIVLIDLPPRELMQRLREGKIYLGDMKHTAVENYFTEKNLTALRELALKAAARNVSQQIIDIKKSHRIEQPWPVSESVLICLSPHDKQPERLIHNAKHLADSLNAKLLAVYVENTVHKQLSAAIQTNLEANLRLAERLGAETMVLSGFHPAKTIIEFAMRENVTHIFVGKGRVSAWREKFTGSTLHDLVRRSNGIQIHIITDETKRVPRPKIKIPPIKAPSLIYSLIYVCALVAAVGLIAHSLPNAVSNTSVALLLILVIITVAYVWGIIASLFAAIVSFLYFDFFHLYPIYSLAIEGLQRLLTFFVFIITAVIVGQLMSHLKNEYEKTQQKQARTAILYRFTKLIANHTQLDTMLQSGLALMEEIFHLPMMLWLAENNQLILKATIPASMQPDHKLIAAINWSWQNQKNCGTNTETLADISWYITPLQSSDTSFGIIAIQVSNDHAFFHIDQQHLFQSMLDQLGVGIYKMRLETLREKSQILAETDKLRHALLSSVSHDLRTPLASIMGSLSSYLSFEEKLDAPQKKELLTTALEESERLNHYIANLLALTKIEAGVLKLHGKWTNVIDLIQHANHALKKPLANYHLALNFAENLPMIWVDPILTEQVFINVLDNAIKYSSTGSHITITATANDQHLTISIADQGRGLLTADLKRIFDMFYRVEQLNDSTIGSGLGLAICKGILTAENATIEAHSEGLNRGSVFIINFYKIKTSTSEPA